jgi:hypothetical protein
MSAESSSSQADGDAPFFNDRHISVRTCIEVFRADVRVKRSYRRQGNVSHLNGGGRRQRISSRSRAATRRLRFYIRNTPANLRVMATLTYPTRFPTNGREVKRHLKSLMAWLRRRDTGGVWTLEFQRRGAPHFHMFLTKRIQADELRHAWNRIISTYRSENETAFVRIQTMPRRSMALYAAKQGQATPDTFTEIGRFWGHFNLPQLEPTKVILGTAESTAPIVRIARKCVSKKRRKRLRIDRGWNSFMLYDGAKGVLDSLRDIPEPLVDNT